MSEPGGASESLVKLAGPDGRAMGTGFVVDGHAHVLTCHHVAAAVPDLRWSTADGRGGIAEAVGALPDLDVVLLRCPGLAARPLPIGDAAGVSEFWTAGFHFQGHNVAGALPTTGRVAGTVATVRYRASREYEIQDALALTGCTIDHGLSGAPLVDSHWGVAFAIANTKMTGDGPANAFALPLARLRGRSPVVDGVLDENARAVPRYGSHLNGVGAAEVCRRVSRYSLEPLEALRLVVLDRYCDRDVATLLTDFTRGAAPVLALVGPSGVGKTTELARMAATSRAHRPAILLQAKDSSSAAIAAGLPAMLEELLGTAAAELLPAHDRVGALTSALADRRLLILLDGLNEAPSSAAGVWSAWLGRSLAWLRDTGTQVVVTCRSEYWQRIADGMPPEQFHEGRSHGHALGYFTHDQAAEALDRYDLSGSGLRPADVSHPFMARIYWELGRPERRVRSLSRYRAMQRYVEEKGRRVALAADAHAFVVDEVLTQLASAARQAPGNVLTRRAVADIAASHPRVISELFSEHLIVQSDEGARFAFDLVRDFLVGQSLRFDELVRHPEPGPVTFALLRCEREAPAELSGILNSMIDALIEAQREASWPKDLDPAPIFLLVEAFRALERPADVLDEIGRLYREVVMVRGSRVHDAALELLTALEVGTSARLSLLRHVAPCEHSTWDFGLRAGFDARLKATRLSPANIAADCLTADPDVASRALARWIGDSRRLRRRSTVSDLALGLLWWARDLAPATLCEAIVAADYVPLFVIEALVHELPAEMAMTCAGVGAEHGYLPRTGWSFVKSLRFDPRAPSHVNRSVIRMFDALRRAPNEYTAKYGLDQLRAISHADRESALGLTERFASGEAGIPLELLVDGESPDLASVLEAARSRFLPAPPQPEADETLRGLAALAPDRPDVLEDIAALALDVWSASPQADGLAGDTVADLLGPVYCGLEQVPRIARLATVLADQDGPAISAKARQALAEHEERRTAIRAHRVDARTLNEAVGAQVAGQAEAINALCRAVVDAPESLVYAPLPRVRVALVGPTGTGKTPVVKGLAAALVSAAEEARARGWHEPLVLHADGPLYEVESRDLFEAPIVVVLCARRPLPGPVRSSLRRAFRKHAGVILVRIDAEEPSNAVAATLGMSVARSVDKVVMFDHFRRDDAVAMVDSILRPVREHVLKTHGSTFELTPATYQFILDAAEPSYTDFYGLRHVVEVHVEDLLAELILTGMLAAPASILVDVAPERSGNGRALVARVAIAPPQSA